MQIIKPVVLTHPDGYRLVPKPGEFYAPDDPLVKAFPWAFSDDGRDPDQPDGIVESVSIETADAKPGKKRRTTRAAQEGERVMAGQVWIVMGDGGYDYGDWVECVCSTEAEADEIVAALNGTYRDTFSVKAMSVGPPEGWDEYLDVLKIKTTIDDDGVVESVDEWTWRQEPDVTVWDARPDRLTRDGPRTTGYDHDKVRRVHAEAVAAWTPPPPLPKWPTLADRTGVWSDPVAMVPGSA